MHWICWAQGFDGLFGFDGDNRSSCTWFDGLLGFDGGNHADEGSSSRDGSVDESLGLLGFDGGIPDLGDSLGSNGCLDLMGMTTLTVQGLMDCLGAMAAIARAEQDLQE